MRLRHTVLACAVLFPAAAPAHVEGGKVYCIDTDGSGVVTVSSDTGNVTGPTWNPDGSQILYVTTGLAHESHDYAGARFRIVDLPGMEARSLDLPPDVLGARSPAWSPDGNRVAFVGRPAASPDISHNDLYITTLSDGSTANLTNGAVPFIGMPSWSPGGDRIAFTSGYGDEWSLHLMEVDGENPANTEIGMGDAFILNLSWSPDSTRFAVQRMVDENFEICVLNADGSGLVNVSDHPSFDADPAWSPDGTEIVFVSDRDGDLEIYRMAADGSSVIQLTANEEMDMEPAWSSDGKICFVSDRGAEQEATAP